jgi:hypothetical protein
MQFLDAIGLASFWKKIKDWANSRFFSKIGGEINPESGLHYVINGEHLGITTSGSENETIDIFNVDENGMEAISIVKTGGTATQVLMADGSVKTLNANNGIAGLDSKGNVPLAQLGNLDTTVAEVVTALPTTNIKKHIYLIKDTSGVSQNQYEEYIYTGDTSATYDASKWEKLGDFRATVDLADYAKKTDTVKNIYFATYASTNTKILKIVKADDSIYNVTIPIASINGYGFMDESDKRKLDGIANNANNYSLPTASSTTKGGITLGYSQSGKNYPVVLDSNGKAYVNVPWIDTNTTYSLATSTNNGLMSSADKAKIDGIDTTYAKRMEVVGLDGIEIEKIPQGSFTVQSIVFPNVNKGDSVNITFEPATTSMDGFMSKNDKNKLNNIANGATADSAITTAEIDALFA